MSGSARGQQFQKPQRQESYRAAQYLFLTRPRVAALLPVNIRAAFERLDILHGVKRKVICRQGSWKSSGYI